MKCVQQRARYTHYCTTFNSQYHFENTSELLRAKQNDVNVMRVRAQCVHLFSLFLPFFAFFFTFIFISSTLLLFFHFSLKYSFSSFFFRFSSLRSLLLSSFLLLLLPFFVLYFFLSFFIFSYDMTSRTIER